MAKRTSKSRKPEKRADSAQAGSWLLITLACVLLLVAVVRIRLLNTPLERDEGEYAYAGQLLLQGIPPYTLVYNMKLPGTYAAYAVVLLLFGQSPAGIHFGLLVVNIATVVLIYFLGRRLFGNTAGLAAGSSYALLSMGVSVQGLAAHATHFVVLPAMAGLLLLLKGIESDRVRHYLGSGIMMGLAFMMKQPGVVFPALGGLFLLFILARRKPFSWRLLIANAGTYAVGAVLPFGLTCLALYRSGVFSKFWFWTFSYAREYVSQIGLAEGFHNLLETSAVVMGPAASIWVIAGAGLAAQWWHRDARAHAPFGVGLLAFSFLGICPGLYFRPQYFILILPVVALYAGLAVSALSQYLARRSRDGSWAAVLTILFICALGIAVVVQRAAFFATGATELCRRVYGTNPFPESLEIARYLKEHTRPDARIAVLGSEPEIYFYSGRRSATGYIYTYGLMERQKYALTMQQQMISEIEQARPEYLILVNVRASWAAGPDSDPLIFKWIERYIADNYVIDGVIDIQNMDHTEYRWGTEAQDYEVRSPSSVFLYRKRAP
jgi:hypothetical protein